RRPPVDPGSRSRWAHPRTPCVSCVTGGRRSAYCRDRMGSRGDLLALVDGAPGRLRTLQAALTIWTHRERAAAARRATDDEAGDEPAHAPVVPGPFGWDDPDAESELIADPLASASALASPSAGRAAQPSTAGDGPETFSSWY